MKFVELLHLFAESHPYPNELRENAHAAIDDFAERFEGLFRAAPASDLAEAMAKPTTPDVSRETSPVDDDPKGEGNGAQ